jgi:hypothetical protein
MLEIGIYEEEKKSTVAEKRSKAGDKRATD